MAKGFHIVIPYYSIIETHIERRGHIFGGKADTGSAQATSIAVKAI